MGKTNEHKSRFAALGFFKTCVVEAVAAFFFPWSLLYFLAFWGWRSTKDLIAAMIKDWIWTVVICIAGVIFFFWFFIEWLISLFQ